MREQEEHHSFQLLSCACCLDEHHVHLTLQAFKTMALKKHPDKNKNNPKAGALHRTVLPGYPTLRGVSCSRAQPVVYFCDRLLAGRDLPYSFLFNLFASFCPFTILHPQHQPDATCCLLHNLCILQLLSSGRWRARIECLQMLLLKKRWITF